MRPARSIGCGRFASGSLSGSFAAGENPALQEAAKKAQAEYMAALANDLNTAEARAPIFDLIRTANTAIDQGQLLAGDRDAILAVLAELRCGLRRDRGSRRRADAARAGMGGEGGPDGRRSARTAGARSRLTDEAIDALVAERTQAKKQRNFARADQIRNELAEKGIVLEDSKDGVRWKRK